jgi:hypothetical protein
MCRREFLLQTNVAYRCIQIRALIRDMLATRSLIILGTTIIVVSIYCDTKVLKQM